MPLSRLIDIFFYIIKLGGTPAWRAYFPAILFPRTGAAMQIELISDITKVGMPLVVGILFVVSYFFADKSEFFRFLAYFPRKREGSLKIGSVVFGIAFLLIALYNLLIAF